MPNTPNQNKNRVPLTPIYYLFWFFYFTFFWVRAFKTFNGDVMAFHPSIWSDWPVHFTMGTAMAERSLLLSINPLLIGSPFQYHFLANLVSAVLLRMGIPLLGSFVYPSFLFSLLSVWALHHFFKAVLKSSNLAVVASLLFFFSGGFGFLAYFKDLASSPSFFHTLFFPPQKYTDLPNLFIYWKSILDTSLIPQRGFQMGFPLTLIALTLVYRFLEPKKYTPLIPARLKKFFGRKNTFIRWISDRQTFFRLLISGIILGLMPITHIHSFLAAFVLLCFWLLADIIRFKGSFYKKRIWDWTVLVGVSALIGIPLIFQFILQGTTSSGHITWFPGWYAKELNINWIGFWFKNWGILPLVAAVGFFAYLQRKPFRKIHHTIFWLPFLLIFLFGNLFLLQPWIWDNTKILAWASVGFSGLAAYGLGWLWARKKTPLGILSVIFFLVMIFSGALDAYRLQIHSLNKSTLYTREDMSLAEWVKDNTNPKSIWLTSTKSNHFLFNLTGRQPLMTYSGWLWTHGLDYKQVEKDVRTMFQHPENPALFENYNVDYAVIDAVARTEFKADKSSFDFEFSIVKKSPNYTIYDVKKPLNEEERRKREADILSLKRPLLLPGKFSASSGLVKSVFHNGAHKGTPAEITKGKADFQFWYDSQDKRPFPGQVSFRYEGFLKITEPGIYTFYLNSDDGSWLWLDDHLLIDNGGSHGVTEKYTRVRLDKGYHTFKLDYFDNGGGAILELRWKKPGGKRVDLPKEVLFH